MKKRNRKAPEGAFLRIGFTKESNIQGVEQIFQTLEIIFGKSDALAHAFVTFIPRAQVINRLSAVPANAVKFFDPTVIRLRNDTEILHDLVLEIRHDHFSFC